MRQSPGALWTSGKVVTGARRGRVDMGRTIGAEKVGAEDCLGEADVGGVHEDGFFGGQLLAVT